MTEQEKNITIEVIQRYKQRLKQVYPHPNPYYPQPIYEYSEIKQKIQQLEKLIK